MSNKITLDSINDAVRDNLVKLHEVKRKFIEALQDGVENGFKFDIHIFISKTETKSVVVSTLDDVEMFKIKYNPLRIKTFITLK